MQESGLAGRRSGGLSQTLMTYSTGPSAVWHALSLTLSVGGSSLLPQALMTADEFERAPVAVKLAN